MKSTYALMALLALALPSQAGAEQQPDHQRRCPIDTTDPSKPEEERKGVRICGERNGGGIEVTTSEKELKHFFKYPFGRSNHSAPKDVEAGVRHFGGEVKKFFKKL